MALVAAAASASAENKLVENMNYVIRLGYNIGGTAPVGTPATIRSMNKFDIQPNFTLSFEAQKGLFGGAGACSWECAWKTRA